MIPSPRANFRFPLIIPQSPLLQDTVMVRRPAVRSFMRLIREGEIYFDWETGYFSIWKRKKTDVPYLEPMQIRVDSGRIKLLYRAGRYRIECFADELAAWLAIGEPPSDTAVVGFHNGFENDHHPSNLFWTEPEEGENPSLEEKETFSLDDLSKETRDKIARSVVDKSRPIGGIADYYGLTREEVLVIVAEQRGVKALKREPSKMRIEQPQEDGE